MIIHNDNDLIDKCYLFTGTSNQLNENDGEYENITVARRLGLPDLELLRFIHDQIAPGKWHFCEF